MLCDSCLYQRNCGRKPVTVETQIDNKVTVQNEACGTYKDKYEAGIVCVPTSDGWLAVC